MLIPRPEPIIPKRGFVNQHADSHDEAKAASCPDEPYLGHTIYSTWRLIQSIPSDHIRTVCAWCRSRPAV